MIATSQTSSQTDFEDYFAATRRKGRELDFTQHADGTYIHDHVQRHWYTWQIARGERDWKPFDTAQTVDR